MKKAHPITSFEETKILADSRRMQILRWLMDEPATLTQLGARLGQTPARVRHHVQKLVNANLVEQAEIRVRGTVTEKFYRAKAGAFLLQKIILPKGERPALLFAGSHDLVIEKIAEKLSPYVDIILNPVGSLDGLINLRQGFCQLSGAHLLDESGAYNTPYLSRLFPQRGLQVVTLAHRMQGLMLAPSNPKSIHYLHDLAREDIRFLNRNAGSGTRVWLDEKLREKNIPIEKIIGYEKNCATHTAAAESIKEGLADVAIGLQAAALQCGLNFIPLFEERFDLIVSEDHAKAAAPLFDEIQTAAFRSAAQSLAGYKVTHSGEEVHY
ncbi:MAG: helix-turn-helix domain-containing protein [Chloroflexi bacterium]|nr:helix-turn-helix domain-containing protein [Chloroflexota bacterium]